MMAIRRVRAMSALSAALFIAVALLTSSCASLPGFTRARAVVELVNETSFPIAAIDLDPGEGWREILQGKAIAAGARQSFELPVGRNVLRAWISAGGKFFAVGQELMADKNVKYRWNVKESQWLAPSAKDGSLEGHAADRSLRRNILAYAYLDGPPPGHPLANYGARSSDSRVQVAYRYLDRPNSPSSPLVIEAGGYPLEVSGQGVVVEGWSHPTNKYFPYLRTNTDVLKFSPNGIYRTQFDYRIIRAGNQGFEFLYYSPIGGSRNDWVSSIGVNGASGDERSAELLQSLKNYTDYQFRWNVVDQGGIALLGIRIYDEEKYGGYWPVLSYYAGKLFSGQADAVAKVEEKVALPFVERIKQKRSNSLPFKDAKVLALRFDGNLADEAGGPPASVPWPSYGMDRFGTVDSAFAFNGWTEIKARVPVLDDRLSELSVIGWFKSDGAPVLASKGPWTAWELDLEGNDTVGFNYKGASDGQWHELLRFRKEGLYGDGAWHSLAVVYKVGTESLLYFDGKVVSRAVSNDFIDASPGIPLELGAIGSFRYKGLLDDFALYRRALLPDEVQKVLEYRK